MPKPREIPVEVHQRLLSNLTGASFVLRGIDLVLADELDTFIKKVKETVIVTDNAIMHYVPK